MNKKTLGIIGLIFLFAAVGLFYHFMQQRETFRVAMRGRQPASFPGVPSDLQNIKAHSVAFGTFRNIGNLADPVNLQGVFQWSIGELFGRPGAIDYQYYFGAAIDGRTFVFDLFPLFFAEEYNYLNMEAISNVVDLANWQTSHVSHLRLNVPISVNYTHGFDGLTPVLYYGDNLQSAASGQWVQALPTNKDFPEHSFVGDMRSVQQGTDKIYVTALKLGDSFDLFFSFSPPPAAPSGNFFEDIWNQLTSSFEQSIEGRSYPGFYMVSNTVATGLPSCEVTVDNQLALFTTASGSPACTTQERASILSQVMGDELRELGYDDLGNAMLNELGLGF